MYAIKRWKIAAYLISFAVFLGLASMIALVGAPVHWTHRTEVAELTRVIEMIERHRQNRAQYPAALIDAGVVVSGSKRPLDYVLHTDGADGDYVITYHLGGLFGYFNQIVYSSREDRLRLAF